MDPDGHDFSLLSNSPAIGASAGGQDLGSHTIWNVDYRSLAIVEFGYAGLVGQDREWIVLENESDMSLNLQGCYLDDGVTWTQTAPLWLEPGERIRLVNDASLFQDVSETVLPWSSGQLSNQGERVVLRDANGIAIDHIDYLPNDPWPTPIVGAETLVRLHPSLDNHFGSSWALASTLGVENMRDGENSRLTLYPNPAADHVTIDNLRLGAGSKDVIIVNNIGQVVSEMRCSDSNSLTIDISHLRPGLYIVMLGTERAKLVVR